MLLVRHSLRLLRELIVYSFVNRSPWLGALVLALLVVGTVVFAGQVVAPLMYTIF